MKKIIASLFAVLFLFIGISFSQSNTNNLVDEWKERCFNIADQINEDNINLVEEISIGVCCFDWWTATPQCDSISDNNDTENNSNVDEWKERCPNIADLIDEDNIFLVTEIDGVCCFDWWTSAPKCNCPENKRYIDSNWAERCCANWIIETDPQTQQKVCILNLEWNMGINMSSGCLINGQCSYNIYKTLWIRKSDQNPSVSTFVQDIVLGITMFLGTAITIILIISGILYILAAILWKSNLADMAKKWIFNSILWLLLVTWSYAIVRLIQFVATAGWG